MATIKSLLMKFRGGQDESSGTTYRGVPYQRKRWVLSQSGSDKKIYQFD
jgi:hypothetical protein